MNKLNTLNNGGFPLTLDDFKFIDDSVRLALDDLGKALSGISTAKLYGCAIISHGSYIEITEGAILHNGEVFHVYPHIMPVTGIISQYYWNFISSYDPSGSKVFFDGNTHQVYEIRKAVGSINQPIAGAIASIIMADAPDIQSILRKNIIIQPNADFTKAAGIWQNIAIIDRGRASIECGFNAIVGFQSNTTIFTLPPEYSPKQTIGGGLMVTKGADSTRHFAGYSLTTDGKLTIHTPTLESGDDFTFYLIVPPYITSDVI